MRHDAILRHRTGLGWIAGWTDTPARHYDLLDDFCFPKNTQDSDGTCLTKIAAKSDDCHFQAGTKSRLRLNVDKLESWW